MSADPFANTTTVKNILQHIISPKIVSDGAGGYVTKTDLVNVDKILFQSVASGAGSVASPLTQQSGRVTFSGNSTSVTVYHSNVTPTSNIIATIVKKDANLSRIVEVLPTTGSFTILLSNATTDPTDFTVGWFIASF